MAGIIKVDRVQSDSNLAFTIAGANVAFVDASSLKIVSSNLTLAGSNVITNGRLTSSAMIPGGITQIVQTVKTDTFVGSTLTSWTDITGMSVSITPTSASNKILVLVSMQGGSYDGIEKASWRLVRNTTPIGIGDAASTRPRATGDQGGPNQYWPPYTGVNYLDSPSTTSSVTYKLEYYASGSAVFYLNRTAADRDSTHLDARTISTITVMEVAV